MPFIFLNSFFTFDFYIVLTRHTFSQSITIFIFHKICYCNKGKHTISGDQ